MIVAGATPLDGGGRTIVIGLTHAEIMAMVNERRTVNYSGGELDGELMPPIMVFAGKDHGDILAIIREYAIDLRGEERAQ